MSTFVIKQKELASTLHFVQPICTKKTTVPSTSYILFQVTPKELIIKATDLEISLHYSCPLESSDIESEQFLVAGKKLFDIVKELDQDITFTLKNNQINIKSGKVNLSFNIKDAQEFPPLPERIENMMHFDSQMLSDMITKVSFLIPQNNANPALNGLFLEISDAELKMTATDGHSLAQITTDKYTLSESKNWLLPRRAVFELKKILESNKENAIFLGLCGNQLVFSGESFNFFTKLLANPFPEYGHIMKKDSFVPARLNKNEFVKTLRRSTCMLSGQFLATSFEFDTHNLKVSMKNNDVGSLEETLPLQDFSGQKMEMRFYSPYLLNGLQSFGEEQVTCFLKNNTRPIIFESDAPAGHLVYLVMPVSAPNPS